MFPVCFGFSPSVKVVPSGWGVRNRLLWALLKHTCSA